MHYSYIFRKRALYLHVKHQYKYVFAVQLDGELYLAPGFPIPPNSDFKGYHTYIDECLPPESPYLYGLHPNAEIEFLTTLSENLFRTVFEMQPRDASGGEGGGVSREEKVSKLTCCPF